MVASPMPARKLPPPGEEEEDYGSVLSVSFDLYGLVQVARAFGGDARLPFPPRDHP